MEHTAASLNLMATQLLGKDDAVPPARRDAVWMAELVDDSMTELLRSYQRVGGLNNRDAHNMPSKRAVGRICEDLLQIIFPGSMMITRCSIIPSRN
jgi:hypothetical protein